MRLRSSALACGRYRKVKVSFDTQEDRRSGKIAVATIALA